MELTKADIEKADVSKIHSEINQLLNQRFSFITASITIFGFFITSLSFKEKVNFSIGFIDSGLIITTAFLSVLIVMNYFISILTRQYYMLRTYLIFKGYSSWEEDYSKFKSHSIGYTKTLRRFISILGLLMIAISFMLKFANSKFDLSSDADIKGPLTYLFLSIIYPIIIYTFIDKFSKDNAEEIIKKGWEDSLKKTIHENRTSD